MATVEEMEAELEAMRNKRNGMKSLVVEDEITVNISDKIGTHISDKVGDINEAKGSGSSGNGFSFKGRGLF